MKRKWKTLKFRFQAGSAKGLFFAKNRSRIRRLSARFKHPSNHAKRALALATHYIGTREYPAGSNITLFGRWYGEIGVPWCAIFVSYVLSHVGVPFKQAYVPNIVALARNRQNGLRVIPAIAVNAAIVKGIPVLVCFDWTHDGTADHVAFAKGVIGGYVYTIEGNTGSSNWSNGGEVLAEKRSLMLVQEFVAVGK